MPARFKIEQIFKAAADNNASDIYLSPNDLPILRIQDRFVKLKKDGDDTPMTPEECDEIIFGGMLPAQKEEFVKNRDFDYALDLKGIGRFRVNVFMGNGNAQLVARYIVSEPKPLESLGLPDVIETIIDESKTGLILVTGATGSGKTNTLSGMVDYINRHKEKKIITIEDPVEIVHKNKRSSVSQRELYADTLTFSNALRAAMRQRPDVILIGEMRDAETVSTAINASESGHLVLSTLHSINARDTIARILDFYPLEEQQQIRNLLSHTIRATISQRLIVTEQGKTKPLVEIMREDLRIFEAIRDPEKTHDIPRIMEESSYKQMQTFDQHLVEMVQEGLLSKERALGYSENRDQLARRIRKEGLEVK